MKKSELNSFHSPCANFYIKTNKKADDMKRFVIISVIFISAVFRASALDVSITVPVAGSLPYVLKQQYDWEKVTSLTVYGEINDDDCAFLRIMARGKKGTSEETLEYYNGSEKGSLQILDLGNATKVDGGCYFAATELTKLTYPLIEGRGFDNYIGDGAFKYCNNLEEVDLSKFLSLEAIGEKAFYKTDWNLNNLRRVVLPPSVMHVYHGAFYGDFHVSKLPSSLSIIEDDAFSYCTIDEADLVKIDDIGPSSFWRCKLPEKMELNLSTVRGTPIRECYGLKDLTFTYNGERNKVTYRADIAEKAYDLETFRVNISRKSELYGVSKYYPGFSGCPKMKTIILNGPMLEYAYCRGGSVESVIFDCVETDGIVELEKQLLSDKKNLKFYGPDYSPTRKGYMTKDGALFYGDGTTTTLQFAPRSLETYTVPEGCVRFETGAFDDCTDLRVLNLGNVDFDEPFWFGFNYFDQTVILGDRSRYYVESDVVYRKSADLLSLIELVRYPSHKEVGSEYRVDRPFYKDAYLGKHPELMRVRIASDITDVTGLFPEATNLKVIEFESDRPPHVSDADNTLREMSVKASFPGYFIMVPKGSGAYYYANPFWRQFQIKEYDSVADIPSDSLRVDINGRELSVVGLVGGERMEVVNASGQTVYAGAESTATLPSSGVYIVRVGATVRKVVVK